VPPAGTRAGMTRMQLRHALRQPVHAGPQRPLACLQPSLSRSPPGLGRCWCFRSKVSPGVTECPSQSAPGLARSQGRGSTHECKHIPSPRQSAQPTPSQPAQPRRAATGRPAARSARALAATTLKRGRRAQRAAAAAWPRGRAAARSARASGPPPPGARRGPCPHA